MSTFNLVCVLLTVPLLAYLGGNLLSHRERRERALGTALCLTSLFALIYGSDPEARLPFWATTLVAWSAIVLYAFRFPASLAAFKFLYVTLAVLVVAWIITLDARINLFDLPLILGLGGWLAAEGRGRRGARPRTQQRPPKESLWKRSA